MNTQSGTRSLLILAGVTMLVALAAAPTQAAFVAYHDLGALTGFESTGNITTHQVGATAISNNPLDTSPKELIQFSDGTPTGVFFSAAGANGMDSRNGGQYLPPAGATPADPLFNVTGLNLNNGAIFEGGNGGAGSTTFTLTGLTPGLLYDVALYGDRTASVDGVERFTLIGADAATNSSSTGIIDAVTTDMNTRPNNATGNIVRWTGIMPGDDGLITIDIDPEVTSASNIAYLTALRLEEVGSIEQPVPEPATVLIAGLGVLGIAWLGWRRRKQR